MRIAMTLRNGEDESWQKAYVEDKMKKLDKYIDTPAEAACCSSSGKIQKYR